MKVRILSGSQIGQVIEQDRPEAEANIAMGFAELAPAESVELEKPVVKVRFVVPKEKDEE